MQNVSFIFFLSLWIFLSTMFDELDSEEAPLIGTKPSYRYCQRKPNLAPSTRGPGDLIPDTSMEHNQGNGLSRV